MRKILLLVVSATVLWIPAVSVAGDSSSSPAKPATTVEAPDSSVEKPDATAKASSPASTCKSERSSPTFAASHNGQPFTQFYGTNGGRGEKAGANAFGTCVSGIAKHMAKNEDESSTKTHIEHADNPAMTCKAMRGKSRADFQSAYGTRPNAFGKCVADHAHGKDG